MPNYRKHIDIKSDQLGMPFGTASGRLRKMLLFDMARRLGENVCYHCGEMMDSPDDFTIEHKVPWQFGDTNLFWDLDNIAFSHLACNVRGRRVTNKIEAPEGKSWCHDCKEYLPLDQFYTYPSSKRHDKSSSYCKPCSRVRVRESVRRSRAARRDSSVG